jgi:hypothetical protein
MNPGRHRSAITTRTAAALAVVALGMGALAACSSDSDSSTPTTSAQQAYCAAGEQLRTDVNALGDLDLVAEGTDGLRSALDAIENDIARLEDTATASAGDQIAALKSSVNDVSDALSSLSGGISRENVSSLQSALSAVTTSASAVYDTLSDCP